MILINKKRGPKAPFLIDLSHENYYHSFMGKFRFLFIFLFLIVLLFPSVSISATFAINPIKLFFGAGKQTDIVSITNSSEEALSMQVTAFTWDQDEEGMRELTPTSELVVFPRIFTVEDGENRLIRVGIKIPPGRKERPYRLYFEELPMPRGDKGGVNLRTLLKVGISVYLTPVELNRSGNIKGMRLSDGELSFNVTNSGNAHVNLNSIKIKGINGSGAKVFAMEVSGGALLAGRTKPFSLELPEADCKKSSQLNINIITARPLEKSSKRQKDPLSMSEKLDVLPAMCAP